MAPLSNFRAPAYGLGTTSGCHVISTITRFTGQEAHED
jgi:hypothetical protein